MQEPARTAERPTARRTWFAAAISAATNHWPEYLMEAACLGLFMVSACSFTVLLQHPGSVVRQMIPSAFVRRALTGIAMGLTAIALIYSPWGKQSGAHFNPSVTLTFFRLGKIEPWDAAFYIVAQFIGGILGVVLSALMWGEAMAHQNVRYAATIPGGNGTALRLCGGTAYLVPDDDHGPKRFQLRASCPIHGHHRRRSRCHLHHYRGSILGYEHESGTHVRISHAGTHLERPLGLFHRAATWHDACRPTVPGASR